MKSYFSLSLRHILYFQTYRKSWRTSVVCKRSDDWDRSWLWWRSDASGPSIWGIHCTVRNQPSQRWWPRHYRVHDEYSHCARPLLFHNSRAGDCARDEGKNLLRIPKYPIRILSSQYLRGKALRTSGWPPVKNWWGAGDWLRAHL